jgi:rubrerythrin
LFVLLLAIEFLQDQLLDRRFRQERHKKLKNLDGSYECQFCGCRKVSVDDKRCPVCGQELL